MKIKVQKGIKYSICSCGLSNTLPYCDNEHRKYNKKHGTHYKSVKITSDSTTNVEVECSNWSAKLY
ncbi:MAG: CDGSH iron-sulfur domain-containing protein [Dehalococcoidia bacterium]